VSTVKGFTGPFGSKFVPDVQDGFDGARQRRDRRLVDDFANSDHVRFGVFFAILQNLEIRRRDADEDGVVITAIVFPVFVLKNDDNIAFSVRDIGSGHLVFLDRAGLRSAAEAEQKRSLRRMVRSTPAFAGKDGVALCTPFKFMIGLHVQDGDQEVRIHHGMIKVGSAAFAKDAKTWALGPPGLNRTGKGRLSLNE
jgi:hypothetical protein